MTGLSPLEFYCLWVFLRALLAYGEFRINRMDRPGADAPCGWRNLAFQRCWYWLPFVYACSTVTGTPRPVSLSVGLATLVLPFFLLQGLFLAMDVLVIERRKFECLAPREQRCFAARLASAHIVMTCAVALPCGYSNASLGFGLFMIVCCAGATTILATTTNRAGGAKPGKTHEMDETPLRDELASLARAFNWRVKSIQVQAMLNVPDTLSCYEMQTAVLRAAAKIGTETMTVAADVLRLLDADFYTALVAYQYATRLDLRPRIHVAGRRLLTLGNVWAAWIIVFTVGPTVFALFGMSVGPGWIIGVFAGILGFAVIHYVCRSLSVRPVQKAFEAWRDADKHSRRSAEQFACYLIRFHQIKSFIHSNELAVMLFSRKHHPWMARFIERNCGEPADTVLARIKEWLDTQGS